MDDVSNGRKLGTRTSQIALYDRDILQEMHDQADIKSQPDLPGNHGNSQSGDEPLFTCGWFGCKPSWLQKLCTSSWLLFIMCLVTFFQGFFINGFLPSSITSLERRFGFTSQQTGLLISIYDIVSIIAVLFVVYIGDRGHKLRWVSVGCVLTGIAAGIFALPHFTTPAYSYTSSLGPGFVCANSSIDACSSTNPSSEDLSNYYFVFVTAMVVGALGSLPIYTLGLTALDESVSSASNGLYLGIFYAVATLGPGCGFLVAGVCLSFFTELRLPEGLNLDPLDPGWVGAWWIGFLLSCGMLILIAIPLSLFPRELPTTAKIRAQNEDQSHKNSGSNVISKAGFGKKPSDFLKAVKFLIINPTFMFTVLGGIADTLITNSFGTFLPKFFENQFSVSASLATILTGIIVVVGGIIGTLNGGFISRRYKLKVPGMLRLIITCNIISALLFLITFWQCPRAKLAGVTVQYDDTEFTSDSAINVTHSCNSGCSCSEDRFIPVCADGDEIEYLSPCHAGCTWSYPNGTFPDCACLGESSLARSTSATFGGCSSPCPYYYPFVYAAIATVLIVVNFTSSIPELNVLLRSVPDSQRSMALGLNSLLKRVMGAFPGPILFGAVIDSACLLWQDTCGTQGSCWVYDNWGLAWRIAIIAIVLKSAGISLYILGLALYNTGDKEDKNEKHISNEVVM